MLCKLQAVGKILEFLETTLGMEMKSQSEEHPYFLQNAEKILGITAQRFFQPWIQPGVLFRLSKYAKPYYQAVDVLNSVLKKVKFNHHSVRTIFSNIFHFHAAL